MNLFRLLPPGRLVSLAGAALIASGASAQSLNEPSAAARSFPLLGAVALDSLAHGADVRRRIELATGFGERHQLRLSTQVAELAAFGLLGPSAHFVNARATWRYTVYEQSHWTWRLGLTAPIASRVLHAPADGRFESTPRLHVAGEASLDRRWLLGFDADTLLTARGLNLELGVRLSYQLAPNLALIGGYHFSDGIADGDDTAGFGHSARFGLRLRF